MTDELIFYYLPLSRHSEEAKELLEKSGLEFKTFALDSKEKLGAVARDAFMFYGGPNKAPALWDQKENKFYEGLKGIEEYISSHTK